MSENSTLTVLSNRREASYSRHGVLARFIKQYRWKDFSFKSNSHLNSEEEQEIIGELRLENTSIKQFSLMKSNRLLKSKSRSWRDHYLCKCTPNQPLALVFEGWMENWLKLQMTPHIEFKKGLFSYTIQLSSQPKEEEICKALQQIEALVNFIKKASF